MDMQENHHFVVSATAQFVQEANGPNYKRIIQVVENGRIRDGFVFQNGIHGMLAERIMKARPELSGKVQVKPDNKTVSSMQVPQFLSVYNQVIGLTGTSAHAVFDALNDGFTYITVPRQRKLARKDFDPIMQPNQAKHLQAICQHVLEDNVGKPIIVFCEDDAEIISCCIAVQAK